MSWKLKLRNVWGLLVLISNNWEQIKIGELCDITMGQSPKSKYYNSSGEGMPFLQGTRTFGDKYPEFDTWTSYVTKEATAGDVIMSVRAPVGNVNITPLDMCLGRGVCGLRHKEGNQEFLYYLLQYNKEKLVSRENGTIFGSVNKKDIANLEVNVPPLAEQRKIGKTLATIDNRIAINKKINHHLVQIAEAIYSSIKPATFVRLSDIMTVSYGKDHKNLEEGIIPCYGSGGIMRYVNKSLYRGESVLIPRKGSLQNVLYINENFWTLDTMFFTKMKIPNLAKYAYFYVKSLDLVNMNVGSAVPSMTTAVLNSLEMPLPTSEQLVEFEEKVRALFMKIDLNNQENKNLFTIRATLLPQLMSREVSIVD
ncbi:restriction endonuclease subunit S [Marinilactibacillus psychrotolerans]|uniref:restriction endonuclease subunit S n=1 Tax=Marinilactibacillus psychrotolerans TaxID=191770 RepID=UPI0039B0A590